MDSIGKRIRSARKRKRYTLNDIRSKTGLSTGNLSDLENDKFMPSANALILLKDVLGVSIDWILTGKENPDCIRGKMGYCNPELREEGLEYCTLSDEEKKIISDYRLLDNRQRDYIKGFIKVCLTNKYPIQRDGE